MGTLTDTQLIEQLYEGFFSRSPLPKELDHWRNALANGLSEREVVARFYGSKEFAKNLALRPSHRAGHFYSPIVDTEELAQRWRVRRDVPESEIQGVELSIEKMDSLWANISDLISTTNFVPNPVPEKRFYLNNNIYPIGDATILRAVIGFFLPKRIIEIGSGFSTACMLDTLDEVGLNETTVTCIEPYPQRLQELLRDSDKDRLEIIATIVQETPLNLFDSLGSGDILFIDSSHVVKAGSDVVFELFEIIPRLAPGVLVHFHDIQYPFEYPDQWIFIDKYAWNEIYAVRAFLMYNREFEVVFMNSFFARKRRAVVAEVFRPMLLSPGGGIWLRRREP